MKYLKIYEGFKKDHTFEEVIKIKKRNGKFICADNEIGQISLSDSNLIDLNGIERFTNLKRIFCDNNKLTSLKGIENLKKLITLSFGKNYLTNIEEVKYLKNLEILDCAENSIESLEPLKNLPKFHTLYCQYNQLKNLDVIMEQFFPNFRLQANHNPWEFPLPTELKKKYNIPYDSDNFKRFNTYECQKEFLTKHPDRIEDLIFITKYYPTWVKIDDRIKKEFKHLFVGSGWGFFDLERSSA